MHGYKRFKIQIVNKHVNQSWSINLFLRREQQNGYKQCKKRLVHPLLKAQERFHRRRNPTIQFSTSSTPTTPPSPTDCPQSPVKATMYTQLNESNQPETVLAPSNSFKQRKYRHRRVGSIEI